MDRMAKIADKIAAGVRKKADFGDVNLFLNVFDFFDTPENTVEDAEVNALRDAVFGEAMKTAAWRNMHREIVALLRRDRALAEFMKERGITFK